MNPLLLTLAGRPTLADLAARQGARPSGRLEEPQFYTLTEAKRAFSGYSEPVQRVLASALYLRMVDPSGGRRISPVEGLSRVSGLRVPQKAVEEVQSLLRRPDGIARLVEEVEGFRESRRLLSSTEQGKGARTFGRAPEPTIPAVDPQKEAELADLAARGGTPGFGTQGGQSALVRDPERAFKEAGPFGQLGQRVGELYEKAGETVGGPFKATAPIAGEIVSAPFKGLEAVREANRVDFRTAGEGEQRQALAKLVTGFVDAGLLDVGDIARGARAVKSSLLKAALDSPERAFKEAALKAARSPDEVLSQAIRPQEPPPQRPGFLGRTVEQSARDSGVGLAFRKAQEAPGATFREPKVEAPGYSFRPKATEPTVAPVQTAKVEPTKIGKALEGASQERATAFEAMQKARSAQNRAAQKGGKQRGSVAPLLPEELAYFKAWAKEKGLEGAKAVEDFLIHAKEIGEDVARWASGLESETPKTGLFGRPRGQAPTTPAGATTPSMPGTPSPARPRRLFQAPEGQIPEVPGAAPAGARTQPPTGTAPPRPPTSGPEGPARPVVPPTKGTPSGRPTVGKADVDATRRARGLAELTDQEPEKVGEWLKEADEKGLDRAWVNRTAEQVAEKPRQLSDSETVAFLKHRQDLLDEFDRLKKVEKPTARELEDLAQVEREFDRVDGALRTSGREWGRSGVARQLSIGESFDELTVKARAKAAKKAGLTPEESARLKRLTDDLARVTKERDDLAAKASEQAAESVVKSARPRRFDKGKIRQQRQDILSEIDEILKRPVGGPAGAVGGAFSPGQFKNIAALAKPVQRLALNLAAEGAATLEDVVVAVQRVFQERYGFSPERQAIVDAIGGKGEGRPRTEEAQRAAAVKAEAARQTTVAQMKAAVKAAESAKRQAKKVATAERLRFGRETQAAVEQEIKGSLDEIERGLKESGDALAAANRAVEKADNPARTFAQEMVDAQTRAIARQMERVEKAIEKGEKNARDMLQGAHESNVAFWQRAERDDYRKWWRENVPDDPEMEAVRQAKEEYRRWWRAQEAIADAKEQLATGVFKPPRLPKEVTKEMDDLLFQKKVLQARVRAEIEAMRPRTGLEAAIEAVNSARTLQSVGDFSVLLRQAVTALFRHPVKTLGAFTDAARGTFDRGTAAALDEALRTGNPEAHLLRQRGGLHLPEIGSSGTRAEENFAGRLVKGLPGWGRVIEASERNMVLTLNQVRASIFDDWAKTARQAKGADLAADELKELGTAVNALTGRGSLGKRDAAFDALSTVFFAPRFAWSRFQTLANTGRFGGSAANRVVGRETRKAVVTQVVGTIGVMEAGEAAGWWEVNWTDPSKSDWLQVRIGDRLIDPWGGYRQVFRVPARVASDVSMQARGEAKSERGFSDLAFEFAQYKAGPLVRVPEGVLQGRDFLGRQIEPGFDVLGVKATTVQRFGRPAELAEPRVKALAEFFTPLSWPEATEAIAEKDAAGLAIAPLVLLGLGTRVEKPKKPTGERGERSERGERKERAER